MKKLVSLIAIIACIFLCTNCKSNINDFNCNLMVEGVVENPSLPITSTLSVNVITDTIKINNNDIVVNSDDELAKDAIKWLNRKVRNKFTRRIGLTTFYRLHCFGYIEDKRFRHKSHN